MRRLLFVAHHFPPLGGPGVQRAVKLVKYLPELDILPVVITGPGESTNWWSPTDDSLLRDVPTGVSVHRAPLEATAKATLDRLVAVGHEVGREARVDAVLVSMSPFSHVAIGAALSRRLGVPWIADLRDPWALDEFQVYQTAVHRLARLAGMMRGLSSATTIIANTPEAARRLRRLPGYRTKQIVAIPNGYDSTDFPDKPFSSSNEQFTIVHAGYLHTSAGMHQVRHSWQYALLGRTRAGVELLPRSHVYLIEALARWLERQPEARKHVVLKFVGQLSSDDRDVIRASRISPLVETAGYLSHAESLQQVRTADLLFLPLHRLPTGQRATIVPGKTYEYMASGRPILAAVPDGDAKDYLLRCGTATVCEPADVESMAGAIATRYAAWASGAPPAPLNPDFIRQFERRRIAEAFAVAIGDACRQRPRPH